MTFKEPRGFLLKVFPHNPNKTRSLFHQEHREETSLKNFFRFLCPAVGIAFIFFGLVLLISLISVQLPGPIDLAIIATGVLLLGGALIVALAEKKLLSEHAYQYNAAARLFSSARIRLEDYLSDMREGIKNNDKDAIYHARENLHDLLYALGKEALDENSEWLILHRSRPIEPVMAA